MKIALYTPWNNRWKGSLQREFERRGHQAQWVDNQTTFNDQDLPDILFTMWVDAWTVHHFKALAGKVKLLTYLRAYDAYQQPVVTQVPWDQVSAVFFCAPQIQAFCQKFYEALPARQHMVLNWIDPQEIPLPAAKKDPHKIAMVANVNFKKGFELALQAMDSLSKEYTLDVAGGVQDTALAIYLEHMMAELGLQERVFFHGPVKDIPAFLADKHWILSASHREGCPMNIIEGMASGCTHLVHTWPGAQEIFHGEMLWKNLLELFYCADRGPDEPKEVRARFLERFALQNCRRVVDLALEACHG